MFQQTWSYALSHQAQVWIALREHVALSVSALLIALLIGVTAGAWSAHAALGRSFIAAVAAARVVPSLAVLALVLPFTGIGFRSALIALVLLACPPILINTDVALRGIEPSIKEAATGMGMRARQQLIRIEYPLALPVIIAGVRTSTVEVIASATLAAFIGGGGLGTLILDGLANNNTSQLLVGGVTVALLALCAEAILSIVARVAALRYGQLATA